MLRILNNIPHRSNIVPGPFQSIILELALSHEIGHRIQTLECQDILVLLLKYLKEIAKQGGHGLVLDFGVDFVVEEEFDEQQKTLLNSDGLFDECVDVLG